MTVLVTGGTKGIGLGVARRLSRDSENLILCFSSDTAAAAAAADALSGSGANIVMVQADISQEVGVQAVADSVDEYHGGGPIHIIHAAVAARPVKVTELTPAVLSDAVAVNALPLVTISSGLRKQMGPGSTITLVSSQGPRKVVPKYSGVAASKAAAETLIRYLAVELSGDGIRANTVVSGPVKTDALRHLFPDVDAWFDRLAARNPGHRAVTPSDVGELVAYLISPEAAMVTGQTFTIDGGASVLSG